MSKVTGTLKLVLFGVVILFMTIVGIFLLFLSNTEALAIEAFETETGLKFPEQYNVLSKSGSWNSHNPIKLVIKINDSEYQKLAHELQLTPHYNDSLYLFDYFTGSDKINSLWTDNDSVYFYWSKDEMIQQIIVRKKEKIVELELY